MAPSGAPSLPAATTAISTPAQGELRQFRRPFGVPRDSVDREGPMRCPASALSLRSIVARIDRCSDHALNGPFIGALPAAVPPKEILAGGDAWPCWHLEVSVSA